MRDGFLLSGPVRRKHQPFGKQLNIKAESCRVFILGLFLGGRVVLFGGDPIGLALTGILLQTLGVIATVLILTSSLLVLAIASILNPHVRHALPLAQVQAQRRIS